MYTDPRGPQRVIVALRLEPNATYATLDCGHTSELNAIYTYRIGESCRCLKCRGKAE